MTQPLQREILHASANETANGNSIDFNIPGDGPGVFHLDSTAFGGTAPTLDVVIEEKDLISGQYFTIVTFTTITGVAAQRQTLADHFGETLRARWTIGGTAGPNFTFSLGMIMKDRG